MTSLTISGIVSGLDTSSIIDKLVSVEGNSQTLLKTQQTAQKSAVSAYSNLLTSVGNLASQMSKLANTSSWATTSATSTDSSVTATATGKTASSLSFTVTRVAASHTLISAGTVNSTSASVASSGSLTLSRADGTSTSIDVGGGTLAEVVAGINGAGAGITATAVQTAPGQYRLQVGATKTGDASQFSLSGIEGFTSMNTLTEGANATIRVGSGLNAYDVESTTNTFSNVVSGISFTVSKETASAVTVSSSVDPGAVSDQISSIVTNANNLLTSIAANTAWDSTSKTGGPLLGDSTVRSLQQGILSIVGSVAAPGLSVTSAGQVAFDKDAFSAAFMADPAAVMGAYGASSTFTATPGLTATATYTNATSATFTGSYPVNVSSNAKAEQWQVVAPGTGIVGRLLAITRGSTTVSYTVEAGEDTTAAAAKLNTKLAQAGMGVTATTEPSGNLVFTASNAGTAGAFTATIDGGGTATKTRAGSNISGTIDGVAATGIGNILSVPVSSASRAAGLSIAVNASDADIASSAGAIGTINYTPGLAQRLDKLFSDMSDSATGQLVTAQAQASAQVSSLQDAIESWTTRLDAYRSMLNTKFTAMESALSSLKSQSTALSSYFSSSSSSSSSS
jgi:flagellar hook-associated protein 2